MKISRVAKALFFFLSLFLGYTPLFGDLKRLPPFSIYGFEYISLRIKGMGEELVGISSDSYTDIFHNPAYLKKSESISTFANYNRIPGERQTLIGSTLFPAIGFGLLSGTFHQRSKAENVRRGDITYPNSDYIYQDTWRWGRVATEKGNFFKGLGSFSFSPLLQIGVSYQYGEEFDESQNRNTSEHNLLDPERETVLSTHKHFQFQSAEIKKKLQIVDLGLLWGTEETWNLDLVGRFEFLKNDSSSSDLRDELNDYDPDGDGFDPYGGLPYFYYFHTSDKASPSLEGKGGGLMAKLSFPLFGDEDFRGKILFGFKKTDGDFSGTVEEIREKTIRSPSDTSHSFFHYSPPIQGNRKINQVDFALGTEGFFLEDIRLGFALRFGFFEEKSEIIKEGYSEEKTDTLFSTSLQKEETRNIFQKKFISLPAGLEKTFDIGLALRFGINPRMEERKITEENSKFLDTLRVEYISYTPSLEENFSLNYSLGLGYELTDQISIDLFTKGGISNLSDWQAALILKF